MRSNLGFSTLNAFLGACPLVVPLTVEQCFINAFKYVFQYSVSLCFHDENHWDENHFEFSKLLNRKFDLLHYSSRSIDRLYLILLTSHLDFRNV